MPAQRTRRLATDVAATLKPLEKRRLALGVRSDLVGLVVVLVVALSAWLAITLGDPSWSGLAVFGVIFASLALWVVVGQRAVGSFERDYTALAMGRLLEHLAPGLSYEAEAALSRRDFEVSGFLTHPVSRLVAKGRLAGEAGGRQWTIGYLQASRGHGRLERLQFVGLLARTESPVKGRLLLRPRGWQSSLNDPLARITAPWGRPQPEGLSPAFRRRFDAFGSDPFFMRQLLTPERQEQLVALADSVGRELAIAIDGSRLHVAVIEYFRLFNPALHQSLSDRKPIERVAAALEAILAVPDALAQR